MTRTSLPYVLLLAGVAWLGWYLLDSPQFTIRQVDVVGNNLVPTEQLVAAANVSGQNIFTANTGRIARTLLSIKPIQSVSVAHVWPAGIRLNVVERQPAYLWKVHPTLYLVSKEGIVLATTTAEDQPVIVVDSDNKPVSLGDVVDLDALEGASYLLGAIPEQTGITPRYFEYSRATGLILPTDRGFRVVFGNSEDLERKVLVLKAILDEITAEKLTAQLIDLRIKDRPYFRSD